MLLDRNKMREYTSMTDHQIEKHFGHIVRVFGRDKFYKKEDVDSVINSKLKSKKPDFVKGELIEITRGQSSSVIPVFGVYEVVNDFCAVDVEMDFLGGGFGAVNGASILKHAIDSGYIKKKSLKRVCFGNCHSNKITL